MMVRERAYKSFQKILLPLGSTFLFILSSCNPTEISSSGVTKGTHVANDGTFNKKAYVYLESPYIQDKKAPENVDMKNYIQAAMVVSENSTLTGNCNLSSASFKTFTSFDFIQNCIHSYVSQEKTQTNVPLRDDGTYIFPVGSDEFYQANALFHVQKGVDRFFNILSKAYAEVQSQDKSMPRSIPYYLGTSQLYWFKALTPNSNQYFKNDFLSIFSKCSLELNAQFLPAGPELCFGGWSKYPTFFVAQDPSVIYHELGHALVSVMMNTRNGINASLPGSYHALRSNLGGYGYDEAGAVNEGIADYYSYIMTARTHMGEWALGKPSQQSRPMSEDDDLHFSGIDKTPEGRLSYPQYLHYDPNEPNVPYESVHYAGQIVSHYLVALTEKIAGTCGANSKPALAHEYSTSKVLLVLAETLSELGDLRATGIDHTLTNSVYTGPYYFNNLDKDSSYLWTQIVNPVSYRRFFQTFAKNIRKLITGSCAGFTHDMSEKLLDEYGLLLFRTYNDNGTSTKDKAVTYRNAISNINGTPIDPTKVDEASRRKSVLVSKKLLSLATTDSDLNRATYYIIDDQTSIKALLSNLLFKGFPVSISKNIAGTEYNNGNIQISPGEVVAVIPNLYNGSNSTMAGVQLLANDWDHVEVNSTNGNYKPCVIDDVTTTAQGAVDPAFSTQCSETMKDYRRMVKGSKYEAAAPVCMVQVEDTATSSKWVSQNEFRYRPGLNLEDKDCLGFQANTTPEDPVKPDFTFNPHECLVRMLPGVNKATFSKIEPMKSYSETIRNGNSNHKFGVGNALLFEVNKWIPPGTKFRCRLRARFSNCSDCYSDPADTKMDDYPDYEYNGSKPYKIINFEFEVND